MIISNIDASNIDYIVAQDSARVTKQTGLFNRFKNVGVPIQSRKYIINNVEQTNKINNKIENDFFSEIIQIKIGYMLGTPVTFKNISTDDTAQADELVQDFIRINAFDNILSDACKMSAITGYGALRLYIDSDSSVKIESLPSYNCYFYDNTAIHFYSQSSISKQEIIITDFCDVYDDKKIVRYTRQKTKTSKESKWIFKEEKLHLFNSIPLIRIDNNDELIGDCDNVLNLIDAYNRVLSDINNEVEQFRLAYMVFTGYNPNPNDENFKKFLQTGAIYMPDKDCTATFLIKPLPTDAVDWFLKKAEQNIYKFSQTPNMSAEAFAGNSSGVALGYLYRSFEFKCKSAERSYSAALRQMMKLVTGYWNFKHNISINYLDYDFIFTRNLPANILEESQIQMNLKGLISDETRLAQLSFVSDPQAELESMQEDSSIITELAKQFQTQSKANLVNTPDKLVNRPEVAVAK